MQKKEKESGKIAIRTARVRFELLKSAWKARVLPLDHYLMFDVKWINMIIKPTALDFKRYLETYTKNSYHVQNFKF